MIEPSLNGLQMIIAIAGLRGVGKTKLANAIGCHLDACVLSRATIHDATFGRSSANRDSATDNKSRELMYQAAEWMFGEDEERTVILDGDFSRVSHINEVALVADSFCVDLLVIELVCDPRIAISRLEHDEAGYLYRQEEAAAEFIPFPKLVIDTERPFDECVEQCLKHLERPTSVTVGPTGSGAPHPERAFDADVLYRAARRALDKASREFRTLAPGSHFELHDEPERRLVAAVDHLIEETLAEAIPGIGFRGAATDTTDGDSDTYWVFESNGRSTSVTRPSPLDAFTLSLIHREQPIFGLVCLPHIGRRYWAAHNQGSYLYATRLRTSTTADLSQAIVGLTYDNVTSPYARFVPSFRVDRELITRSRALRRSGSPAADFVMVADGSLDAAIAFGPPDQSTTTGILVAREAGADVVDLDGRMGTLHGVIAITPALRDTFRPVMDVIRELRY